MKKMLWSMLALLSACAPDANDAGGVASDLQSVLDAAVFAAGGSEADTLVYRVGELSPGSTVEPLFAGEPVEITEDTTLFLVDPLPEAGWSKPVQWVYVDEDGDVRVEDADWFPVVDGADFDPAYYDAEWGEGGEAVADVEAQSDLLAQSARRRGAGPPPPPDETEDPCEKTINLAITISAWNVPELREDELNMSLVLGTRHDYEVTRVDARLGPAGVRRQIQATLQRFTQQEENTINHLVIFYAGHGARSDGTWVMGKTDAGTQSISPTLLADWVAPVDAEKVTIISNSCFSAKFGQNFIKSMRGRDAVADAEVTVIAAAKVDESAFVKRSRGRSGSYFGHPFVYTGLLPLTMGSDIDWNAVTLPPPITVETRDGRKTQTANRTFSRPGPLFDLIVPEGHPNRPESCVAGHLPPQEYAREVRLRGRHFGAEAGKVYALNINNVLHELDVVFWRDNNIIVRVPMRKDGFPSDKNLDVEGAAPGWYPIIIERGDDKVFSRDESFIEIETQVYEQTWVPDYSRYVYPSWVELWHPLTPPASWTKGATIHQSLVFNTILDDAPAPIRSDTPAAHVTTADVIDVPHWSYELLPAERDLNTAYQRGFPEQNFYGFRMVFTEDFRYPVSWGYSLVYD